MSKKVFVSGCYDLLHSGHVEFFMPGAGGGGYLAQYPEAIELHIRRE